MQNVDFPIILGSAARRSEMRNRGTPVGSRELDAAVVGGRKGGGRKKEERKKEKKKKEGHV